MIELIESYLHDRTSRSIRLSFRTLIPNNLHPKTVNTAFGMHPLDGLLSRISTSQPTTSSKIQHSHLENNHHLINFTYQLTTLKSPTPIFHGIRHVHDYTLLTIICPRPPWTSLPLGEVSRQENLIHQHVFRSRAVFPMFLLTTFCWEIK